MCKHSGPTPGTRRRDTNIQSSRHNQHDVSVCLNLSVNEVFSRVRRKYVGQVFLRSRRKEIVSFSLQAFAVSVNRLQWILKSGQQFVLVCQDLECGGVDQCRTPLIPPPPPPPPPSLRERCHQSDASNCRVARFRKTRLNLQSVQTTPVICVAADK